MRWINSGEVTTYILIPGIGIVKIGRDIFWLEKLYIVSSILVLNTLIV
jgi:hypothetical protein